MPGLFLFQKTFLNYHSSAKIFEIMGSAKLNACPTCSLFLRASSLVPHVPLTCSCVLRASSSTCSRASCPVYCRANVSCLPRAVVSQMPVSSYVLSCPTCLVSYVVLSLAYLVPCVLLCLTCFVPYVMSCTPCLVSHVPCALCALMLYEAFS